MTDVDIIKVRQHIAKSIETTAKIQAETNRLRQQKAIYPIMVGSAAILIIAAIVKLFL